MLKSLAALGVSIGLKAAASIAIFIVAGVLWDAGSFGDFMYSFAVASVLVIGCEYGFTNQLLKNAVPKGQPFVTRLFRAKLALGIAAAILAHAGTLFIPSLRNDYFLPLFYSLLATSFFDFLSTTLKAHQRLAADFHLTTWTTALYALCALSLLASGGQATELSYTLLITRIIGFIAGFYVYRRYIGGSPLGIGRFQAKNDLSPIKTSAPYATDTAINAVLNVLDGIILTHISGPANNGIYQIAARLNQAVPITFSVLASFFLPKLGQTLALEKFKHYSFRFLALTAAAWLMICILFSAAWLIYRSSPPASTLHTAASLLPGLAAIALVRLFCGWMSVLLIARDMQSTKTRAYGLALLLILLSSTVSIDQFGIFGIIISYGLGFAACFAAMAPATFKAYRFNNAS